MKSRRELAEEQFNLVQDIRYKLDLNIVTCGNCGTVLLHKSDVENIHCYECNEQMEPCHCPDLWYDSDINNYEEVISIEPTIILSDVIQVAERLNLDITIYEVKQILDRYKSQYGNSNDDDNFSERIEDLLYQIISERVG